MGKIKKILAYVLAFALCFTSLPSTALVYASTDDGTVVVADTSEQDDKTTQEGENLSGETNGDEQQNIDEPKNDVVAPGNETDGNVEENVDETKNSTEVKEENTDTTEEPAPEDDTKKDVVIEEENEEDSSKEEGKAGETLTGKVEDVAKDDNSTKENSPKRNAPAEEKIEEEDFESVGEEKNAKEAVTYASAYVNGVLTYYDDLEEAIDDAAAGTVVTLLNNTTTGDISITKNLTVDLNGQILTVSEDAEAIHQKAGLNLTIDGANGEGRRKLQGQIIIDGDGRAAGTETLTIQNIDFEGSTADFYGGTDSFILIPSTKNEGTPYYTGAYNYAHNVTVKNCSFTSTSNSLDVVGIKATSGATQYNMVVENVTGTNLHSLGQLTATQGATFENCNVSASDSFLNIDGGGQLFTVKDCTFVSAVADGYAIREKGSSSAIVELEDNNFTTAYVLQLGKNDAPSGEIRVKSGSYKGELVNKMSAAGTAKFVFSGGKFSVNPELSYIVPKFYVETVAEDIETPCHVLPAGASLTDTSDVTTYHRDLQAAVAQEKEGTVELLKDDAGTTEIEVRTDLTLDIDEYNVTSPLTVADGKTLSISGTGVFTNYPQKDGTGALAISGAYFPQEVAEGYIPVHQAVQNKGYTVEAGSIVARIGAVGYGTFKEAATAANASEDASVTITLITAEINESGANVTFSGKNVTITSSVQGGTTLTTNGQLLASSSASVTVDPSITLVTGKTGTTDGTTSDPQSSMTLKSSATVSELFVERGALNIEPSAHISLNNNGAIHFNETRGEMYISGNLNADEAASLDPSNYSTDGIQLDGGYFDLGDGDGQILEFRDTVVRSDFSNTSPYGYGTNKIYVTMNNSVFLSTGSKFTFGYGTGSVNGHFPKATFTMTGSHVYGPDSALTLVQDTVNMDSNSKFTVKSWNNAGIVNVDVTGITVPYTLVEVTGNAAPTVGTINLLNNESTKYAVAVEGNNIVITDSVAAITRTLIGTETTTYYKTLSDAFRAANSGDTIVLVANVTDETMGAKGIVINDNKTIIFDLAGFNVTCTNGTSANNRAFTIRGTTSLSVINTSSEKSTIDVVGENAYVTATSSTSKLPYGAFRAETGTTLNITGTNQNIKLKNGLAWGLNIKYIDATTNVESVEIDSYYGGGIEVAGGTATLTGSKLTQTGISDHCSSPLTASGGGTLTISDSDVSAMTASTAYGHCIYVFNSGATINVEGGTFYGATDVLRVDYPIASDSDADSIINVTDGIFAGNIYQAGYDPSYNSTQYTAKINL